MQPKTVGELKQLLRNIPNDTPLDARGAEDEHLMFWVEHRTHPADLRNDRVDSPWVRLYVAGFGI